MKIVKTISILLSVMVSCTNHHDKPLHKPRSYPQVANISVDLKYDTSIRSAHIFVALCDNKYQGIIPVPATIGNGDDLNNNLYWGCSNGIRSYFHSSKNWSLLRKEKIDSVKLERLVFKHRKANFYLVCDAYRGRNIKVCTIDFLKSGAGQLKDTIQVNNTVVGINGNSKLVAYIGHNGLMDFKLNQDFQNADNRTRDAVILACKSKQYFFNYLRRTNNRPLLWTSNLMCPEAYTIHDFLEVYIKSPNEMGLMSNAASNAYSTHQKCSMSAAKNLLVTGF